ncbi:Cytochrome P450 CYP82J17 [Linum perenne]
MLKSSTLQLLRPPKPDQIPMDLHLTISDHLVPISLLTITTTLFLLLTFRRRNKSRSDNHPPLPPEPAGGLPILGHLIQLSSAKKTLAQSFVEWSDRYGPIFTFRLGTQRAVVVNDPETVKECFTTHDRVLASRPVTSQGEYLHCQNAAMGSTPYGSYWRDIRKLAVTQLLSVGRLKSLRHVQVAEIDILMKELHQISQTGETIAISELLDQLGFNLITTLIAGKRYFNYGVVDGEDHEEGERIGDLMREFMRRCATFVMSDFVPFVRWIDWFFGPLRSMRRTGKQLDDVMQSWIEEHRVKKQRIDREEEEEGSSDFIDVMHLANRESVDNHVFLCTQTMIVAGSDTTSITMTWILSNLLNNPHTMALAQQELDEKVGRARPVQYSDIENLIYLQAVSGKNFEMIPFGFGRRSCPGMAFATQVVNLTVARLLQGFDITSCHIPVDMSQGLGLTMPKATPLEVRLTPRLPAHLYQTGSK